MTTVKIAKGIRQTANGFQIYARINGEFISQHFPPGTPVPDLVEALKTVRARAHLGLTVAKAAQGPTLQSDVKEYLKAMAGLPTLVDRTHRIEWWRDTLGRHRTRDSITAVEIRQQLEALRKAGKKPGTLNVYRTALMSFFTVMNGRGGANPAKDTPHYHEHELPLSLPSRADVLRVFDQALRFDGPRPSGVKSQARLRVLLWTGWPSAILKQLRPADIHWRTGTVLVHGRKKGGGTKPRTVPLMPQALEALKMFAEAEAWGPFSGSALHSTLHRWCDAAGVSRFRVYDLRHLFGTRLVATSHDERGTAELMLHSSPQQTWRYSRHAASTRALSTIEAMKAAEPMERPQPRLVRRRAH
jgi:integrase